MIEKVNKVDNSEFAYLSEDGISFRSKTEFLKMDVLDFCGCGDTDVTMKFIKEILEFLEKGNWDAVEKRLPDAPIYYFVMYWLDHKGFSEHGTSVNFCWLTDKGKELLKDINWCLANEKD